jgi:DNA-binding NarL/FixJ family response regulator
MTATMTATLRATRTAATAEGTQAALSRREYEVLALMAAGRSNGAIAGELAVSAGAVEKHVANIFDKLGLVPSPDANRRVLAVLAYLGAHRALPVGVR